MFGCHNPTGFYKQASRIVPSSSCQGSGCSAFRVTHATVADGLEQAAVAEGALIAAHRVGRLAAAPERDAVRRRRRSLHMVAEFLKHIPNEGSSSYVVHFIFVIESNKVNMSQCLTRTENDLNFSTNYDRALVKASFHLDQLTLMCL